jgi:PadR family transcriptional regulator PadR
MVERFLEKMERDLVGGVLHLAILAQIGIDGPVHGYSLIRALGTSLGGAEPLQSGTLYPILKDMEKEGLVRSRWAPGEAGPQRKEYEITPQGRQALRASVREWDRLRASIDDVLGRATAKPGMERATKEAASR